MMMLLLCVDGMLADREIDRYQIFSGYVSIPVFCAAFSASVT
jgi:hypothetical protein